MENGDKPWEKLTHEEKNHVLYLRQKETLDRFLKAGAISREQHDRSLRELQEKMNER